MAYVGEYVPCATRRANVARRGQTKGMQGKTDGRHQIDDSGSMAISYEDMRIDEKTLETILTQLVFLD